MARPLRLEFPGALYHVFARGNARAPIFIGARDYQTFLEILGLCCARHGFRIHAYALMPNHHHLLLATPLAELSRGMKLLHTAYARYFNDRHEHVGHLFQGRFKSLLVDRQNYGTALVRYIERNPIQAGLADQPWDYPWSSCRSFLGLAPVPSWLAAEETLSLFGEGERRLDAYREFVAAQAEDPTLKATGQSFLGSPDFVERMKERAAPLLRGADGEISRGRLLVPRAAAADIERIVLRCFTESRDRCRFYRRMWEGRRQALSMLLLREYAGLSIKEIALRYGVRSAAASAAISRLQKRVRSDPSIESSLEKMRRTIKKESEVLNVET